jgi:hypothetical protein
LSYSAGGVDCGWVMGDAHNRHRRARARAHAHTEPRPIIDSRHPPRAGCPWLSQTEILPQAARAGTEEEVGWGRPVGSLSESWRVAPAGRGGMASAPVRRRSPGRGRPIAAGKQARGSWVGSLLCAARRAERPVGGWYPSRIDGRGCAESVGPGTQGAHARQCRLRRSRRGRNSEEGRGFRRGAGR